MKNSKALIAAAIVGSLSLTAIAPAAIADDNGRGYGKRDEQRDRGHRGFGERGGFVRLMCSEDGAARLETALGKVSDRITLTDEQQALYDNFKTSALAAQTEYADTCTTPSRDENTDMIDRLKERQANVSAMVAAMDDVIPSLEAFYDSLTDEQKAELKPQRDMRHGPRGERGDRGSDRG